MRASICEAAAGDNVRGVKRNFPYRSRVSRWPDGGRGRQSCVRGRKLAQFRIQQLGDFLHTGVIGARKASDVRYCCGAFISFEPRNFRFRNTRLSGCLNEAQSDTPAKPSKAFPGCPDNTVPQ